jgi:hypothetical protein
LAHSVSKHLLIFREPAQRYSVWRFQGYSGHGTNTSLYGLTWEEAVRSPVKRKSVAGCYGRVHPHEIGKKL